MTRRIVDYVVVGASSPAGLREKVMKHLTQDPCWELAGPATNAPVTREGGWYTQTLLLYERAVEEWERGVESHKGRRSGG